MTDFSRTALSVNLNKIALLRNQRDIGYPSVVGMARLIIEAGADGITVHPRPDERHIRAGDVSDLATMLRAEFPDIEYNVEGYPDARFLDLVAQICPHQVTFVPDAPDQTTSDHGWDIDSSHNLLVPAIEQMKKLGIRVALFIDEDPNVPPDAKEVGADRVEMYTGPFGANYGSPQGDYHLGRLAVTARAAHAAGIGINAGHDLCLENLSDFIEAVPNVLEVSIGHAITAEALIMGFPEAVRAYKSVLAKGEGPD